MLALALPKTCTAALNLESYAGHHTAGGLDDEGLVVGVGSSSLRALRHKDEDAIPAAQVSMDTRLRKYCLHFMVPALPNSAAYIRTRE
jgi:hypothetical protein